jgi:hypothetical protein
MKQLTNLNKRKWRQIQPKDEQKRTSDVVQAKEDVKTKIQTRDILKLRLTNR